MAIQKDIRKSIRPSSGTSNDELLKLLGIAEEEGIPEPQKRITPLERIMGALRASETSGLAEDILSGKPIGESLKQYKDRIAKGWTLKGLNEEDLSNTEGYKDVLTKRGVSDKPWFEVGPIKPSTAGVLGFAGDVLLDPLTYASFGTTAAGKTAAKTAGKEALEEMAQKAGVNMIEGAGRKVTSELAQEGGESAIKKVAPKLGKSWSEQAELGQKGLINMFGKPVLPNAASSKFYSMLEGGARKLGGTPLGESIDSFRKMFNDDLVKLSEVGTETAYEKFQQGLAKRAAKNVENAIKTESYQKAMEFRKSAIDIAKEGGKKPSAEKYTSIMGEVIDRVEKTKPGKIMSTAGLDEGTAKFALEVKNFRDYLHKVWTEVGGKELTDDEIGYWIHTLPYQSRDKIAKQFGYSAREFTDKVASDLTRGYMKIRSTDGVDEVVNIKKLLDDGWAEIDTKGLPAGLFSGKEALTFKQLQAEAKKKFGIDIKYVPETGMYKGRTTLGEYGVPGHKMKIATARNFEDVMGTQYHETVHALDAMMGEMKQMGRTFTGRVGERKGAMADFMQKFDTATKKEWDGILRATGDAPEMLTKDRLSYRKTPTELWAWAAQYARKNPEKAAEYFPTTASMVPQLDSFLKRFGFNIPKEVEKDTFRYGIDKLLYNKKTGEVVKAINATIKEVNEKFVGKFSTDIPFTTYMMGARIGKKAAGTYYLNLVQGLGKPLKEAPDWWVQSTNPMLKKSGLAFNPEIARAIDNAHKAYFSDEAVKDVLTIYDKLMGVWKTSVTSWAPAFHTRNFVSNVWQNWLAGVRNPKDYTEAVEILTKIKSGSLDALSDSQRKIYQSFLDNGLFGFGYFGGDIQEDLLKEVGEKGIKKTILEAPGEVLKKASSGGLKVGGAIENTGKLAHYINKVKAGYSNMDAAASVRKYLFDYADLTATERNVFKRLMPFYTFTRKNLPMELESFISNPSDFANLAKLMRVAGYSTHRQEELPSYVREKPMYKMGDKYISGGILDVPALEPIEMIGERPARTIEKTLSKLLSPAIKAPMEVSMDRSMFQGRPLSEVTNVEPVQAKMVIDMGLKDALGVKENKSKNGEIYYTTTDPNKWHVIRNIFSRFYGVPTSMGKLSKEDLTLLQGIITWSLGLQPKTTGAAEEAGVRKETIEQLKKLLQGKIYEGSYIGKVKE